MNFVQRMLALTVQLSSCNPFRTYFAHKGACGPPVQGLSMACLSATPALKMVAGRWQTDPRGKPYPREKQ